MAERAKKSRQTAAGRRGPGFTLLEMLVVLIIIGLLVALVAPRVVENVGESKVGATEAQILLLENAVQQFRLDMGRPPTEEEGLEVLLTEPTGDNAEQWDGPYLQRDSLPKDGWGNAFEYTFDEHDRFVIRSLGADGRPGGENENADLDNRSL